MVGGDEKAGYEAILYFLSTDDVEVNIARVAKRVIQGGHDIPQAIIRSRYAQSHSYLKIKLREFREVYLIDSTTIAFAVQSQITNGVIVNKTPVTVQWVRDILSITERLTNRNKQQWIKRKIRLNSINTLQVNGEAFVEEIGLRIEELETGKVIGRSWEEVKQSLRQADDRKNKK